MNLRRKAISVLAVTGLLLCSSVSFAGNEDRAGSAGATELLINPWAQSSGWADAGVSASVGLEALHTNVAGLAFTKKTEVLFTRTNWLSGSGININAIGFSQKVGESGVIGLGFMSMDFGDIEITTTELPEGGVGNFSPQYFNMGLAYAKEFSNSIYGGINMKIISEGIADVRAQGVAFDAGIRYVTGERDQIKFGIALKNVGPPISFEGDGLSVRADLETEANLTVEQRSAGYELPSLINIGASYDFTFSELHELTLAASFTSNSFTRDQFRGGLEYRLNAKKAHFMLRGGYVFEKDVTDAIERATALTGPTAGISIEVPVSESGTTIGVDYSYRATNPFDGSHSIGARINMK